MGRYDGILICSDIDGTLTWSAKEGDIYHPMGPTPEVCEAIRRFQAEGGRFTVSTGRAPSHLQNFADAFTVNAPVVAYGGAVVYDIQKDKLLRQQNMTFDLPAVLELARPYFSHVLDVHIHHFENVHHTTPEEVCAPGGLWKEDEYLKIVLVVDGVENAVSIRRALQASPLKNGFEVCRSWPEGVELMNANAAKGSAVRFLKEYLGVHTLICVGDFENDLTMAPAADRFVAVENAIPELKALADEITVPVWEGALARVIESL